MAYSVTTKAFVYTHRFDGRAFAALVADGRCEGKLQGSGDRAVDYGDNEFVIRIGVDRVESFM